MRWAISASDNSVRRRKRNSRIFARKDFSAEGLTAGVKMARQKLHRWWEGERGPGPLYGCRSCQEVQPSATIRDSLKGAQVGVRNGSSVNWYLCRTHVSRIESAALATLFELSGRPG